MFLENYMPIHDGAGKERIAIRIESSWRCYPEVLFRYYEKDNAWTACWMVELPDKQIISFLHDMDPNLKWDYERLKHNQAAMDTLRKNNPTFSFCTVDNDTAKLLDTLRKEGLPKPEQKSGGQDGHSYFIRIEGFPGDFLDTGEYHSWCYLPKEWGVLEGIINRSVEYAGLDPSGYGARINRHSGIR